MCYWQYAAMPARRTRIDTFLIFNARERTERERWGRNVSPTFTPDELTVFAGEAGRAPLSEEFSTSNSRLFSLFVRPAW
jgi:hypothetical protein